MLKLFLIPLILKVGFLYQDDHQVDHFKPNVRPTYRISVELHPTLGKTRVSVAMSEVTREGLVKPLAIYKVRLED